MAVVVTVALVPVAAAYLQLGYAAPTDVDRGHEATSATRALEQVVAGGENHVAGAYSWTERDRAVGDLRAWLDPRIAGIESPNDPASVAVDVTYNQSRASRYAATACPGGGPGRAFGPCDAIRGVVVQERAGEAVVVAVALDVRVVTPAGWTAVSDVYEP